MSSTLRGYDRHQSDYYVTPKWIIRELFEQIPELFEDMDGRMALDPCPCGAPAKEKTDYFDGFTVICNNAECVWDFPWFKTPEEAILRWNDRAPTHKSIIKDAVQAIEDIMPSSHDQCPENSVCHLCDILTLEPTLEALKGLIDV